MGELGTGTETGIVTGIEKEIGIDIIDDETSRS
jgi:hypothetical protein